MNLEFLDKKLWVALACPTSGLEIDSRTLELIDMDNNGRIRPGELVAAVKFAGRNLKNADDLVKGDSLLPISSINDAYPEGKILLASARQILINIGKPEASSLSVGDVADKARIFANTAFNGDGVITELSATEERARIVIQEIMECTGFVSDLSGKPGIDSERIELFFAGAEAYQAWTRKGQSDSDAIFPFGITETENAAAGLPHTTHALKMCLTVRRMSTWLSPRAT